MTELLVVFDLDGVILDTEALVVESYRRAGAEPPRPMFAQEGTGWLAAQLGDSAREAQICQHREYLRLLPKASPLPPFDTACRLRDDGCRVGLLSGATPGAVEVVRAVLPAWPFEFAEDGIKTPAKMRRLAELDSRGHGVYVDDQARLVVVPSGWRFVHYVDQTADRLYGEVLACVSV